MRRLSIVKVLPLFFAVVLVAVLCMATLATPVPAPDPPAECNGPSHVGEVCTTPSQQNGSAMPTVLNINAANGNINWTVVGSFASLSVFAVGPSWTVKDVNLEGFGETMRASGFQAALEQSEQKLVKTLAEVQPSALVVSSKGVNVLTYLAAKGLWNGPTVLLSPIPNSCDHLGLPSGGATQTDHSWEDEWESTMRVLVERNVGPIAIGIGTSADEQDLIADMMVETGICGNLVVSEDRDDGEINAGAAPSSSSVPYAVFETCRSWSVRAFHGDHAWTSDPRNAANVASLIDEVLKKSP